MVSKEQNIKTRINHQLHTMSMLLYIITKGHLWPIFQLEAEVWSFFCCCCKPVSTQYQAADGGHHFPDMFIKIPLCALCLSPPCLCQTHKMYYMCKIYRNMGSNNHLFWSKMYWLLNSFSYDKKQPAHKRTNSCSIRIRGIWSLKKPADLVKNGNYDW